MIVIQSDHRPEHLVSFAADEPLSAVRDFHDQPRTCNRISIRPTAWLGRRRSPASSLDS